MLRGANQSSIRGCDGCDPLGDVLKQYFLQELVFLVYNNTFILLYFLRWQVGGYSPHSLPPKSVTDIIMLLVVIFLKCIHKS